MPISLSPKNTFPVSLSYEQHLSEAERPTFTFRYVSGETWLKIAELNDALQESKGPREAMANIYDRLRLAMRGWANLRTDDADLAGVFGVPMNGEPVELPFRPELLEQVLTIGEAQELLEGVMKRVRPDEDDRKN